MTAHRSRDPLTPEQRSQRARTAAFSRWGSTPDRVAATQAARDKFDQRFEREVDAEFPGLPAETRAALITSRRSAYFAALAFRSSRRRAS